MLGQRAPMNYPPPQPQPPLQPAKKKGSGCLLALAIAGGVIFLVAVVGGVMAYRFAQSPEGQKAISIVGEGTKIATESLTAPGTKELRALGCTQATVVDTERLEALGQRLEPDAAHAPSPAKNYRYWVTCQVDKRSSGFTCDQVAATYRSAVGAPPGPFLVTVGEAHQSNPTCSTLYGADGARLGDMTFDPPK